MFKICREHLKSAIPDNEEKDKSDEKLKTETETIKVRSQLQKFNDVPAIHTPY